MKLTTLFILAAFFSMQANDAYGQRTKITLDLENVSVEQLIDEIERSTEFEFVYKLKDVNLQRTISITVQNERISKILKQVFKNTNTRFNLNDKRVYLVKRHEPDRPFQHEEYIAQRPLQSFITGTVTDTNGQPLPGTSLVEKGTTNGTTTDFDGNFSIAVADKNAVLIVSYIGFTTKEIPIDAQTNLTIVLEESAAGLDEVVVIGYGTQEKRAITSSVTSVKVEDFNQGNINSPQQLLQGKVSGLTIARPGGDPNEEFSIRLRGVSTLGANTQPLIVIDGLAGGSLQSVDPNDIASIDVLKDGGAAAIYGTRGSSGVILITTKKGRPNHSEITYNAYLSMESEARSYEVADAAQFSTFPNVQDVNILGSDTKWLEEISRSAAVGTVHSLSASGGGESGSYRASVNYRDIEGMQRFTGFDQINARVSFDQRAINDHLRLNGFVSVTAREENRGFNQAFRYANFYNPTAPVRNADGSFFETGGFDTYNPVAIIEQNTNKRERDNIVGGLKLDLKLAEGLKVAAYYGLQIENTIRTEQYGKNALFRGADRNGLVRKFNNKLDTRQFDATLTYDKDFGGLNLGVLLGTSYQQFDAQASNITAGNFVSGDILDNLALAADVPNGLAQITSIKRRSKLFAVFARVNLNYDNTYFLSAAIRPEGHDRFGENNKWGTFGSLSGGIDVVKLFETEKLGPFEYLKIRGSWGLTGTIPAFNLVGPSQALLGPAGSAFSNGAFVTSFGPISNPNPDLKWEEKTELNFGLDFALFERKLTGTIDYYTRTTSDLLRLQSVPVPPNLFGQTLLNVGEIENSGLELAMEYQAKFNDNFTWTPGVNLATFKNTLKALDRDDLQRIGTLGSPGLSGINTIAVQPGNPIGQISVPVFNGINADGTWNVSQDQSEFIVAGNGLPDFTFNFINTFTYKDWDFNFLLRGVFGHSLVNTTRIFYGQRNAAPTYNVLASADRAELQGLTVNEARLSDFYVEKADFLRMDNITLGYTLPGLSEDTAIKSFRLYLSGQNLFTISGYEGVDPEPRYADPGTLSGGAFAGASFNAVPDPLAPGIDRRDTWFTTRTITLGVNVGF